jgi:hypothetical protein
MTLSASLSLGIRTSQQNTIDAGSASARRAVELALAPPKSNFAFDFRWSEVRVFANSPLMMETAESFSSK